MIPNDKDVYKPRRDGAVLSRLVQAAWAEKNAELEAASASCNVGEVVARHLEQRFPLDDMKVLQRYGAAKLVEEFNVTIFNDQTKLWDQGSGVKLPRAVLIPTNGVSVNVCGPRFSEDPTRGVFPDKWAAMSGERQIEIIDFQDRSEARALPKSVEPFFQSLLDARRAYRDEYKQTTEWPSRYRGDHDKYPTWGAILDQFPVLGTYVNKLRESEEVSQ